MTLDEAITHAREVAKENREMAVPGCDERAAEHEQLAAWLTELKERREADRWIPVSERLPENDEYVLVYDNSDMFVAWFSKKLGWCSFDGDFDEHTPIIAWKPLPKPYESEDK